MGTRMIMVWYGLGLNNRCFHKRLGPDLTAPYTNDEISRWLWLPRATGNPIAKSSSCLRTCRPMSTKSSGLRSGVYDWKKNKNHQLLTSTSDSWMFWISLSRFIENIWPPGPRDGVPLLAIPTFPDVRQHARQPWFGWLFPFSCAVKRHESFSKEQPSVDDFQWVPFSEKHPTALEHASIGSMAWAETGFCLRIWHNRKIVFSRTHKKLWDAFGKLQINPNRSGRFLNQTAPSLVVAACSTMEQLSVVTGQEKFVDDSLFGLSNVFQLQGWAKSDLTNSFDACCLDILLFLGRLIKSQTARTAKRTIPAA